MHLITLDAVRLYLTKLAPGGVLLFNISNRHLVLEPVLGAIARAAGLAARTRDDVRVSDAERTTGKVESQWVVMARREEDLGALRQDPLWKVPAGAAGPRAVDRQLREPPRRLPLGGPTVTSRHFHRGRTPRNAGT